MRLAVIQDGFYLGMSCVAVNRREHILKPGDDEPFLLKSSHLGLDYSLNIELKHSSHSGGITAPHHRLN